MVPDLPLGRGKERRNENLARRIDSNIFLAVGRAAEARELAAFGRRVFTPPNEWDDESEHIVYLLSTEPRVQGFIAYTYFPTPRVQGFIAYTYFPTFHRAFEFNGL